MDHFRQAQVVGGKKVKTLYIEDELETFDIRFRVHIPDAERNPQHAEMRLIIKDTIVKSSGGVARE